MESRRNTQSKRRWFNSQNLQVCRKNHNLHCQLENSSSENDSRAVNTCSNFLRVAISLPTKKLINKDTTSAVRLTIQRRDSTIHRYILLFNP